MVEENTTQAIPVPSQPTSPIGGTSSTTPDAGISGDAPSLTIVVPTGSGNKAYGQIVLTLENVHLPPDKINPTPSALDGLDSELEFDLRIAGCELISLSGILLKLPQTAMATGQVLFQRFYYSKSFLRQDMELTAMSCIYLASKIEEAPRRIRDVINVFHHIKQLRNGKPLDPMILDQSYIRLKSDVTLAERRVLKELGFCVHVKHPHKLIVVYMQQLGCDKDSNFVQRAWNFMSDALRTNVFVRYTPEAIACACIYLSARQMNIPLPANPSWYLVFDVQEEQIIDICESILDLYGRAKVSYEAIGKNMSVLVKEFKDSRQSQKSASSVDKSIHGISTVTISPNSRPASPNLESDNSTGNVKAKENVDTEKIKVDKRKNEDLDPSGRKSSVNSPEAKKARRSPSPIIFNDSPQRHKKKKRRKSRSESSSPRDRKQVKKHIRRERDRSRSRSPYSPKRQHHKKSKSHHNHRDHRYRSRY